VLQLAEGVGRWLADNAIRGPQGFSWPNDTLNPESVGYDLGSGVAGKAVYFAALYRATGNSDYLDMALGAADYLISVIEYPSSSSATRRCRRMDGSIVRFSDHAARKVRQLLSKYVLAVELTSGSPLRV
jgi:hypothetical protein